jgi:hypothetical protein
MKRLTLTTIVLGGLALVGTGWVNAETPNKPAAAKPAAKPAPGGAAHDMGGGGNGMMMGGGGNGMMMGGGMCPMGMMGGADTQLAVKNLDKGVTMTFTSNDPTRVARLQKMAEAMRLMHEATTP